MNSEIILNPFDSCSYFMLIFYYVRCFVPNRINTNINKSHDKCFAEKWFKRHARLLQHWGWRRWCWWGIHPPPSASFLCGQPEVEEVAPPPSLATLSFTCQAASPPIIPCSTRAPVAAFTYLRLDWTLPPTHEWVDHCGRVVVIYLMLKHLRCIASVTWTGQLSNCIKYNIECVVTSHSRYKHWTS